MKLKIVWCNGDKETIDVCRTTVENILSRKSLNEWDQWRLLLKAPLMGINMKYVRKFSLDEE